MSLANNLKEARINKGLKQEELAKLVGKSKNVISNWERGDNKPDADTLFELCDILDVDANFLLGWESNQNISLSINEQNHIKKYRSLDSHGKELVDIVLEKEYERRLEPKEFIQLLPPIVIPSYGHIASAGTGQYIFDDIPPMMIEIENTIENQEVSFAIDVNGDSMEPTYHDEDTLLVKKQDTLRVGEIGIFMVNGEAYVKELAKNALISHNKAYNDIPLTENTICIGKVIGKIECSKHI